jgi:hypothetical protein
MSIKGAQNPRVLSFGQQEILVGDLERMVTSILDSMTFLYTLQVAPAATSQRRFGAVNNAGLVVWGPFLRFRPTRLECAEIIIFRGLCSRCLLSYDL